MDSLDKFFKKYSYKFPKGYPDLNDEQDINLLADILENMGVDLQEKNELLSVEKQELTFKKCMEILKKETNLKDSVIVEIEKIYNSSSEPEQKDFIKNFRKFKNIKTDIENIYKIYSKYSIIAPKGTGRGEIPLILGLEGSKSGGQAKKDILIGSESYEIKELTKDNDFRTGAGGSITNSQFQSHFNYLMTLLFRLNEDQNQEPSIEKSQKLKPSATLQEKINFLIDYFNTKYKTGNISEGVLNTIEGILPKLGEYDKTEEKSESKPYIKISGKKYEIGDITTDDKGAPVSVKLGPEVSEQKSLLIKLKNHPWVKDNSLLKKEFNDIWLQYLKSISGLIIYEEKKVKYYPLSEIKTNFEPYRVTQGQISVKLKEDNSSKLF